MLARYIGAASERPITPGLPVWPSLPAPDDIERAVVRHPAVAVHDATIAARTHDVEIAHEQYKPGFALDAGYGARGGGRADFASVMVSVEVPLFTDKRQDPMLVASEKELAAVRLDRDALLLELRKQALRAQADAARLTQRIALYREVVVNRADGAAAAALDGYQNQVSDFAELIRARLGALDTELRLKRLEADLGLAYSELAWLLGEPGHE